MRKIEDLNKWIWLSNLKGISTKKKVELLKLFKTPENIYNIDKIELAKTGFLSKENILSLTDIKAKESVNQVIDNLIKHNINVITLNDPLYPELLKNIIDPPICIYIKGSLLNDEKAIGIVGSRKASGYGLNAATKIASDLVCEGLLVVSGMARGIDSAAHQGALNANGRTVAVLGCGLDICYPPENKKLMDQIISRGAVISEYPPGTQPEQYHFPVRNRIVSGMSIGILVVEASEKSGSLITANLALEQGRDVYALPGNIINHNSRGTNKLIQEGAKLVTDAKDILDEVTWFNSFINKADIRKVCVGSLDKEEVEVVELLKIEPHDIDKLLLKLSFDNKLIHSVLLSLEMKGFIRREAGGVYHLEYL